MSRLHFSALCLLGFFYILIKYFLPVLSLMWKIDYKHLAINIWTAPIEYIELH